ncbi:MAG: efflux RND transporter periplasmic adaptor subunit [Woeseia sp.]
MPPYNVPLVHVLLLPLLILVGCAEEPQQPAQGKPDVSVVTLRTTPVTLTRQLPGRTHAFVIAEVRPQVTGLVTERLFTEGSLVDKGEPLYQLDDAVYRAAHNSARAALARAEAAVNVARLDAERAEELVKVEAISKQEYENSVAVWRQAEADIGVAKAQLASTAVELGYARITSPISGRIGKSAVTQGALVTADQAMPLATVQQLDPIYVDLMRSASELFQLRRELEGGNARVAEGIPVTIILEDGTEYPHKGELAFSDVAVDPMTGSYALRVIVDNPNQVLMPGMYVRAEVTTAVMEQGLLVPQVAVTRDAKGDASAMVVTDEGTVERRDISVSRTVGDDWLVSDGLADGERVVVAGLQKIRPGIQVNVTDSATINDDAPASERSATGTPKSAEDPRQ